jgi:hypothetical protein
MMAVIHRGKAQKYKAALIALYNGKCQYCDDCANVIDHIIPLALGGKDEIENLIPACWRCNAKKGKVKMPEGYTAILIGRAHEKALIIKKMEVDLKGANSTGLENEVESE